MAAAKRPGPQCSHGGPMEIEDGTWCRASSPIPGPVGGTPLERAWFFTPSRWSDSAACLTAASTRASFLLSEALNQETGYTANDLPAGLMMRVRQMLQAAGSTKPGAGSMPGGLRGE